MTNNRQKLREKFWIERFREESRLNFRIDDTRNKQERPDFLIRHEGEIVGLEVTELQIDRDYGNEKGSTLQKDLGLQQSVVDRAQKLYFSKDCIALNAQIYFRGDSGQSLRGSNRRSIAEAIADLLRTVPVAPMEQYRFDSRSDQVLPEPVSFIVVRGLPDSILPRWQLISPGWAKVFDAPDVESILVAKNALYAAYCKTAPTNWLLIVADGSKPPGMFRAPAGSFIDLPRSHFDKTYFLCEPSCFIIEWSESGRSSRIISH